MGRGKVTFFNKSSNLIKVVSTIEGMCSIPEVLPKLSQKFIPSWWKELPIIKNQTTIDNTIIGNIKIPCKME